MDQDLKQPNLINTLTSSPWIYLFGNGFLMLMVVIFLVLIMMLKSEAGRNHLKVLGLTTAVCSEYSQSIESTPLDLNPEASGSSKLSPTPEPLPSDKLKPTPDFTREILNQPTP